MVDAWYRGKWVSIIGSPYYLCISVYMLFYKCKLWPIAQLELESPIPTRLSGSPRVLRVFIGRQYHNYSPLLCISLQVVLFLIVIWIYLSTAFNCLYASFSIPTIFAVILQTTSSVHSHCVFWNFWFGFYWSMFLHFSDCIILLLIWCL